MLIETIAVRVSAEPKLMQAITSDDPRQTSNAFTGTSQPGRTFPIHVEKGSPLSRAKAQICREDAAVTEIAAKNVKITKGEACQLMVESSQNLQLVCDVFKRYGQKIAKKNNPHDPNFLKISITLGRVRCIMPL